MYQVKRCKECKHELHVHKHGSHYVIKNFLESGAEKDSKCEHVDKDKDYFTKQQVDDLVI